MHWHAVISKNITTITTNIITINKAVLLLPSKSWIVDTKEIQQGKKQNDFPMHIVIVAGILTMITIL